jgi:hypothetical protein
MSRRSICVFGFLLSLNWFALPVPVLADDATQVQPEVANSRFQFIGSINSPDVYVRSGPSDSYYPTIKLDQGTQVTVVGIKYDWLKILPPAGSFCYVSKLYVERRGDGSVGRVVKADVNVRAGGDLSPLKTTVQTRLSLGDEVKILGEQDEYFKIAPPAGAFLYVNKEFVEPVKALAVNAVPVGASDDAAASGGQDVNVPDALADQAPMTTNTPTATTQPTLSASVPTTQPAVAEAPPQPSAEDLAEAEFGKTETDFTAASQKSLVDQPLSDLQTRYQKLLTSALPDAQKETVRFRLAVLNVRLSAQAKLIDLAKTEVAAEVRDRSLQAEHSELEERLQSNAVVMYSAVGTLATSSLQYGPQTLYRLTDPATGRTVIYIRGNDGDALKQMGNFVGVRGEATTDDQLNVKVIDFTAMEQVDPNDINGKIIANIVPPSLMAHTAIQASAGSP